MIHLAGPGRLVAVRVTVDGRHLSAHIKGRNGVLINLGGHARARFTLRVVARLRSGATRVTLDHLHTCARAH